MSIKFKIGNLVKVNPIDEYPKEATRGIIVYIKNQECIEVDFGHVVTCGHTCDGHCKKGYGYYLLNSELTLVAQKNWLNRL